MTVSIDIDCVLSNFDAGVPSERILNELCIQIWGAEEVEGMRSPLPEFDNKSRSKQVLAILGLVEHGRESGIEIEVSFAHSATYYVASDGDEDFGPVEGALIRLTDVLRSGDDVQFVANCYLRFLGKHPDERGQAYFLKQIKSGVTRLGVLLEIAKATSLEPNLLNFKLTLEDLTELIQGRSGSGQLKLSDLLTGEDEEFISRLYNLVLQKEVDEAGLAHYSWRLKNAPRVMVIAEIRHAAILEGLSVMIDFDVTPDKLVSVSSDPPKADNRRQLTR